MRDKKGRYVKIDMKTGEIPGQQGKCWPGWVRIKQGIWKCDECNRGPCLLPLLYVVAFENAQKGSQERGNDSLQTRVNHNGKSNDL